ncbi:MAG: TonB-dependent receptor [Acidobacteriota bacterium]|nr:TonB-dependent receptor [Acidobacteriota bacterium]
MNSKFLCSMLLTIVCVVASASLAFGQSDRGVVTGTVTDSNGGAIPDADVTATNLATNVISRTRTTGEGVYTIPALSAGTYKVRIEKSGFKVSEQPETVVAASQTTNIDAALEPGQVSETVEISTESAQLQTENSKISTQVSNRFVEELPLVVQGAVRSPFDLANITPEARNLGDNNFALGGGQGGAWGITLDGVTAGTNRFGSVQWASVNAPSLDAITEFTVDTHGFKAEYGRASGGVMTFTSKSGTNNLHGTLYEFVRNDAFDARRFFEAKRGIYKQHDFGFSVGGPVMLPRFGEGGKAYISGRNRTFFFVSGEFFRNRVGAGSDRFSVPTPEMYSGDFSKWVDQNGRLIPIYDPATTRTVNGVTVRDPFPGNIIPQNRISNFARAVIGNTGVLAPNGGAAPGTSQYVRDNYVNNSGTLLDPWTKFSFKIDHNFSERNKIAFLYNYSLHEQKPGPNGFPGLPGIFHNFPRFLDQKSKVYRGNWTSIIRPTVVNYLYVGVNKFRDNNQHTNAFGGWRGRGICLINAFDCDENFPEMSFSEFSTWGGPTADGSENPSYSAGDDMTITRGRHTFKAGYLYERLHYQGYGRQSVSGLLGFDRRSTSVPGDNNLTTGGGNSFASFLLGDAYSGGTENRRFVRQQWISHSMYFQDDWKVNQRLTLNLGVRYEFTQPPLEADDKWSDLTPDKPNPGANGFPGALRFAGFGEGRENSRTLIPGWYGGIGPRLGFAYSLNDKTVIRGGASRSFGIVKTVFGSTHFQGAITIFRLDANATNGITPAFRTDTGLPPFPAPPSINPAFANGQSTPWWQGQEALRLPETYDWTLSVQRELGKGFVLETSYNATIGSRLIAGVLRYNQVNPIYLQQYGPALLTRNINSAEAVAAGIRKPYASFNGSVAQALRAFPQYNDIDTQGGGGDHSGHSTYHSGIAKLSKRYGAGLTLESSYVLAKLISDADNYGGAGPLDHFNRRLEKSISALDQTHLFKFNYIYELPFGKNKRWMRDGIASAFLGGWRFAAVHLYGSGTPLQFCSSVSLPIFNSRCSLTVTTDEGWIATNDSPDWRGSSRYFNRSVFPTQPNDRLGNTTRFNGKARTPPNYNENISLAKTIGFGESRRLDLRAEAFNVLNRVRFNPGNTNINDPNFGRVTNTLNDPRRMQFAAKFYF